MTLNGKIQYYRRGTPQLIHHRHHRIESMWFSSWTVNQASKRESVRPLPYSLPTHCHTPQHLRETTINLSIRILLSTHTRQPTPSSTSSSVHHSIHGNATHLPRQASTLPNLYAIFVVVVVVIFIVRRVHYPSNNTPSTESHRIVYAVLWIDVPFIVITATEGEATATTAASAASGDIAAISATRAEHCLATIHSNNNFFFRRCGGGAFFQFQQY